MPGLNRRFSLAAIALPLLFLGMSGLSRAATIVVNTLDGGSEPVPGPCSLIDAVAAANAGGTVKNCVAGSGANTITFSVTGTIPIFETLTITSNLTIIGPTASPGITLSGTPVLGNPTRPQLINVPAGPNLVIYEVFLQFLTLANGSAVTGGAIYANEAGMFVSNCTFLDNQAVGAPFIEGNGGAILNTGGTLVVSNSTFSGNYAQNAGGAIYNYYAAVAYVTNNTFSGNMVASQNGGAVGNNPGGIAGQAYSFNLKGNILAANSGGNCESPSAFLIVNDIGYNISDDDSCDFSGTSMNNTNPMLAPLSSNGGTTQTFAELVGSPAIDSIPIAACTFQSMPPVDIMTDQRGYGRPDPLNLNFCDAGAYESGAAAPRIIRGVVHGGLLITSGLIYNLIGGTVMGDVLQLGGSLVVTDSSTITGSVLTAGRSTFSFDDSAVDGSLLVLGLPVGSPPDQICGTAVNGEVLVLDNRTGVAIGDPAMSCPGNTIGRDLLVLDNATVQIFDDMVGRNLLCQDNSTITGGGDTAKSLQGQCTGFSGFSS